MAIAEARLTVRRRPKDGVDGADGANFTDNWIHGTEGLVVENNTSVPQKVAVNLDYKPITSDYAGETFTVSFDYEFENVEFGTTFDDSTITLSTWYLDNNGVKKYPSWTMPVTRGSVVASAKGRCVITRTIASDIKTPANMIIAGVYIKKGCVKLSNIKLERGANNNTVWTSSALDRLPAPRTNNMFENSKFEINGSPSLVNWTRSGTCTVDTAKQREGRNSVYVANGSGYRGLKQQFTNVKEGDLFTFHAWMLAEDNCVQGTGPYLEITYYNAAGAVLMYDSRHLIAKPNEWSLARVISCAPPDTVKMTCSLIRSTAGAFWINSPKLERGNTSNCEWSLSEKEALGPITLTMPNDNFIFGRYNGTTRGDTGIDLGAVAYRGEVRVPWKIGTITCKYKLNGVDTTAVPTGMSFSVTGQGTVDAKIALNISNSMNVPDGIAYIPFIIDDERTIIKTMSWRLVTEPKDGKNGKDGPDGINLLLNSAFENGMEHWGTEGNCAIVPFDFPIALSSDGTIFRNGLQLDFQEEGWLTYYDFIPVEGNVPYTFSFYYRVNDVDAVDTTDVEVAMETSNADASVEEGCYLSFGLTGTGGRWKRFVMDIQTLPGTQNVSLALHWNGRGKFDFCMPKFERGNKATEWNISPNDFSYLSKALQGRTDINGGLVLTNHIKVGEHNGTEFTPKAGINGLMNPALNGRDIAVWTGGDNVDAEKNPKAPNRATSVMRMDGTGYWAKNTIRHTESGIEVGDLVVLNSEGLTMFKDKEHTTPRLKMGDFFVDYAMQQVANNRFRLMETIVDVEVDKNKAIVRPSQYVTSPFSVILGTVQAGDVINISVDLSLGIDDTLKTRPTAGGIRCILTIGGQQVLEERFGLYGTNKPVDIHYDCGLKRGAMILRIYLEGTNSTVDNKNVTTPLRITISATAGAESATYICTDGICASWGGTKFAIGNEYALLQCGTGIIKMTPDGKIMISDTGGQMTDLRAMAKAYNSNSRPTISPGTGLIEGELSGGTLTP